MTLDLNTLGIFSTNELIPKDITIGDQTVTIYIRRLASIDLDRFVEETRDPDREVRVNAIPRVLAKCIRDESGKAHFTAENAAKLKPEPRGQFVKLFLEVNKRVDGGELGNE